MKGYDPANAWDWHEENLPAQLEHFDGLPDACQLALLFAVTELRANTKYDCAWLKDDEHITPAEFVRTRFYTPSGAKKSELRKWLEDDLREAAEAGARGNGAKEKEIGERALLWVSKLGEASELAAEAYRASAARREAAGREAEARCDREWAGVLASGRGGGGDGGPE